MNAAPYVPCHHSRLARRDYSPADPIGWRAVSSKPIEGIHRGITGRRAGGAVDQRIAVVPIELNPVTRGDGADTRVRRSLMQLGPVQGLRDGAVMERTEPW